MGFLIWDVNHSIIRENLNVYQQTAETCDDQKIATHHSHSEHHSGINARPVYRRSGAAVRAGRATQRWLSDRALCGLMATLILSKT